MDPTTYIYKWFCGWVVEHLMSIPSDYWATFLNVDLGGCTYPPDVNLKPSTESFACWYFFKGWVHTIFEIKTTVTECLW